MNGIYIPVSLRGFFNTSIDFSKLKNCYFVLLEISEDVDTPNENIANLVSQIAKAGKPCFAVWSFDPVAVHADMSNGGTNHLDQWLSLIRNKDFQGAFLRITNFVDSQGSSFPSINMAGMIQEVLSVWRKVTPTVYPHKLNRDNIMLMTDTETIRHYTSDENVPTQLARELYLAPCDIYRTLADIVEIDDLDALNDTYSSLELIGLDGEPHSKQDSLYALKPFLHLWGEDDLLLEALSLSNGGKGAAGSVKCYLSLEKLEEFTGMTINVDDDIEEELPLFGIDVSRHQGELDWGIIAEHDPEVMFAAIRAGVSYAYEDDQFNENWQASYAQSIPRAAYHVLYPDESIYDQVGNFKAIVDEVNLDLGEMPVVADIEVHHDRTPQEVAIAVESYLIELERVFGRKPIIYSAAWFMNGHVDPGFMNKMGNDYYWWIAHYRYDTDEPFEVRLPVGLNRDRVVVHQYTDKGDAIGGSGGSMDYNRWVGTDEQYDELVIWGDEPPEQEAVHFCEKVARLWNAHPELWD